MAIATTQGPLFQDAMAQFAGAVTIITTSDGGTPLGMVVTSVCSLSADPPSLIACINKGTSAHDPILRQGFFAVNLVSGTHVGLVRHFMASKGEDRFQAGNWGKLATGAPILDDAMAVFDCELTQMHDGFTHSILIGSVKAFRVSPHQGQTCLLWHGRNFGLPAQVST